MAKSSGLRTNARQAKRFVDNALHKATLSPAQIERRKELLSDIKKLKAWKATELRAEFRVICELVAGRSKTVYMIDKKRKPWITFATNAQHLTHPMPKVSPDEFRRRFSEYTTLVGLGFCFEVVDAASMPRPIYVRRHTSYVDPLRDMVRRRNVEIVRISHDKFNAAKAEDGFDKELLRRLITEAVGMVISCGSGDVGMPREKKDKRGPRTPTEVEFSAVNLEDDGEN